MLFTLCAIALCGTAAMAAVHTVQNSFTAGQISPLLAGRSDLPKYFQAGKTLENVIVMPHGGVTKRPGTYYVGSAKSGSVACRLIPFVVAESDAYVMEFGNHYIRWYMPDANGYGGQVLDVNSDPYEVNSPYGTADLAKLKYVQCADVMYFSHPDYVIRKLVRAGHTSWTITEPNIDYGPFLTENTTATTITPSATTGAITLVADANIFEANHVGSQWQISHNIESETVTATLTVADTNSAALFIYRDQKYDFTTHGKWNGTVVLQRSYDSKVTWLDVRPVHYEEDGNVQYTGDELVEDCWYRVRMTVYTAGSCRVALISRGFKVDGVVEISAYVDDNDVNATVLHTLGSTSATKYWSEGAWSTVRGYPACLAFFEQRLVAAGTAYQPQTIWFSESPGAGGWESFRAGDLASDSFAYTLAAYQTSPVRWMLGQENLLVGTSGSEWKVYSSIQGEPVSATNVPYCRRQSAYGSQDIQAILVNSVALFVQQHGRKLRECVYSSEVETYYSPDLTIMSEDITASGINWIAYQAEPYSVLWAGRTDGDILAMTYQRENEVVAWAKQTLSGDAESGCVIPGDSQDDLWLAVLRTIDGNSVRYIEQMRPYDWGDDQEDAFLVDCGISSDFGTAKAITRASKATPGVITCTAHGFTDGQQVRITGVTGMTELNNKVFSVHAPAANSFSIRDSTDAINWNTTGYTTYVSGGYAVRVGKTFTGLSHLEGTTVACVGDGSYCGTETVDANSVTLDNWYTTVHVGIGYTSKVQPMPLAAGSPYGSSTESRIKRIIDVGCRFFKTSQAEVGPSWTDTDPITFRVGPAPTGPIVLYTGDKEISFKGDYTDQAEICVLSDEPLPFTLLSIMPTWEVYQR